MSYLVMFAIGTAFLFLAVLRVIVFLHILQLEGYKTGRFVKWMISNPVKLLAIRGVRQPKKKLVFTPRATRLFVLSLIMVGLATFVFGAFLAAILAPFLLVSANVIIYPLEAAINNLYLLSARNRLKKLKPRVIAITGSYGKTSTKDILFSILSKKYNVLKTPGSFNTPMGLCKVIRGELKPEHELFIVELGARKRGDIKELCQLVQPSIGIITAIGHQHLEMFRTIETIIDTKYELIEALPSDGIAVFNGDDENCRQLAQKTKGKRVLLYGLHTLPLGEKGDSPLKTKNSKLETSLLLPLPSGDGWNSPALEPMHLLARDISTSSQGISFLIQDSHSALPCHCSLLGKHNISNILAAAIVALELGMSFKEIAEAVKALEPTPHRLQLIPGAGGVTVIDDAFNANPSGARMALEVLAEFKGGRRVLVTPGLVELGEREYEENKQLGIAAAKVCDIVFLVGIKRTKPIFEGLQEAGFLETNIFVEKSLNAATERFKGMLKSGDIVLFENDLPDNYDE